MSEHRAGEIPVVTLPLMPYAQRAPWLAYLSRIARWARAHGQDPASVIGAAQLCQDLVRCADDPAMVAELAALLPPFLDRSDPFKAALYLLNGINGLDTETTERMKMLVDSDQTPPAA